jgi:uncharacterized protein YjbJ (UPF0337 family)
MADKNPTARGLVDKVAGKVKAAAGNLAGRRDLAEEGELQQSRADQADEAARLEAEAEQAADEARARAGIEANAVEQAYAETELAETERLDDIERQQQAEQARAGAVAQQRRAVLDRQEAAEEATLERREAAMAADDAAAHGRADEIERQAADAGRAADRLAGARETIEGQG